MSRQSPLLWVPVVAVLAALGLWLASRRPAEQASAPSAPLPPLEVAALRPVNEGAPCRVRGRVEGGLAVRVRLRSEHAGLDIDAALLAGGAAFAGELPEQGALQVVAFAADGRAGHARAHCGPSGLVSLTLQLPAAPSGAQSVNGACRYLDTGAPVAEALVRASRAASVFRRVHEGAVFASALADEDGRYTLALPPGRYRLRCAKDGDESRPAEVRVEAGASEDVVLWVEAKAAVAGVVVDEAGALQGGRTVTAREGRSGGPSEVLASAKTDAEGRFLVRGLSPGPVVLEVQDGGRFAEAHALAKVALPYAEARLVLAESAIVLEGAVIDAAGEPVEGALVEVTALGGPRLTRAGWSDAAGSFALGGLVSGRHRATARADGYTEATADVDLYPGRIHLQLGLRPACDATVRVLPAEPALPVTVTAFPEGGGRSPWAAAGQTGEALALAGASGRARVEARTSGAVSRTATVTADLCAGPVVLTLGDGSATGAVDVEVTDEGKRPVEGVEVWIGPRGRRAQSGADGKVAFEDLPPGAYGVGARDQEPVQVEVIAGQRAAVSLAVERGGGEIAGVVVARGGAVEGAKILAACSDSGRSTSLENAPVVARSDESGRFAFTPEGRLCTVRAEHPSEGRSRPAVLEAGGAPGRLQLEAGGTLEGRVVPVEGGGAPGAFTLTVTSVGRGAELEGRTLYVADPGGRFVVEDVAPGRIALSVTGDRGRGRLELELGPGEAKRGLEVPLFTRGQVVGRVLAEERALAGADVSIRGDGRALGRARTGADGRFRFEVPAGDPLTVYATAEGYYPKGTTPFDLRPGEPTDIGDVRLEPRGGPEEKEGGIGIQFAGEPKGVRVVRFTPDSPAREAGLRVGDVITAIDGAPAGREPLLNWVVKLRGVAGTPVVLEIERGTERPFSVTVIRRAIGLGEVPREAMP